MHCIELEFAGVAAGESSRISSQSLVGPTRSIAFGRFVPGPGLVPEAFAWMVPPPGAGHTAITLPPEALERMAGDYQLADGRVVTVSLKAAKAFVQVTGMPGQSELLPKTPQRFFVPVGFNVLMIFEGAMDAPATSILINMNGAEVRATRKTR